MLNTLKQLFSPQSNAEEDPVHNVQERLKVATCVLLLEIAHADDEFTDDERVQIIDTLSQRFSLSSAEAHELIDLASRAREESRDLWSFTRQINKACTNQEKRVIIEEIWRVVCADGSIDGHEKHLAHQLGSLMNLSHGQVIEAKVKVLDDLRGN